MDNSFLKKLFFEWSRVYYTTPMVIFCSFLAIFFGIKYYQKEKTYIFFILYSIITFLLFLPVKIFVIMLLPPSRNKTAILHTGNTLFELIEFFVFYYFFQQIIKSNFARSVMKLSLISLLSLSILFIVKISDQNFSKEQIIRLSTFIWSVKFFLLLVPILAYFFEIFRTDPLKDISQSPSLWIISGLFFYTLATLPFILISEFLFESDKPLYYLMFSIHFLSLSFLFLTIIKAFTCRKLIIT